MSENQIRRALDDAAPKEPGFDGWGDKVRKGHRRRRTAISAAAALGVVALGVPVAFQLGAFNGTTIYATPSPTPTVTSQDTSPTQTSEPTPTPTHSEEPTTAPSPSDPPQATLSDLTSEVCADSVGVVTELPDGTLPSGANRIWLCDGDQEPAVRTVGPVEPLTTGVQDVVAAYNALPSLPQGQECEGEAYQQSFALVVEYPDGKRQVVSGMTHACKMVTDGTHHRANADTFFADVVDRFQQQRAAQPFEFELADDAKVCLQVRSFMGMTVSAAVSGYLCGVPEGSDSMYVDPIQRELPQDLVRRIIETAKAEATPMPATEPYAWSQSIVLLSRFGDPITLYRSMDTFYWAEGDVWSEWKPKAELLEAINEHATGMLSGEPPAVSSGLDPCGGDSFPADGSITRATSAVLCVQGDEGATKNIVVPDALMKAMVEGIAANVDKVVPKNNDVTGDAIRLPVGESGAMFFVYIHTNGDLVWSDYNLKETAWTPTPEFRQFLVDNGVKLSA